jgi:hypothetical protein
MSSLQDLAQQGSFEALTAHTWTLRAVAEADTKIPAPGQAASLPGMHECRRVSLCFDKPSSLHQTIDTLLLGSGTFASQLQGLAASLLSVVGVYSRKIVSL